MLYSLWVTHHNYGQHASLDYGCCDLIVGYEKVSFSRNFSANAAVVFIFIFTFKARFTRLSKVVVASVPFFFSFFLYRNWLVNRARFDAKFCDIPWFFVVSRHHSYAFMYKIQVWNTIHPMTRQMKREYGPHGYIFTTLYNTVSI